MSYTLPQVMVFQEFRQLPSNVVANLNAFCFGPNYKLFRYAIAAEKALIGLGAYDPTADAVYAYPNQPANSTVDLGYAKLFMENVWAQYAAFSASAVVPLVVVSTAERNKLRAVPRIEQPEYVKESTIVLTNGVFMQSGGYFYNGPTLPTAFYLVPQGGGLGGFLSRMTARAGKWVAEDATLVWRSADGHTDTLDILATDNPFAPGNYTVGPFGMTLDFDTTAAGIAPRVAALADYVGQPIAAQKVTIRGRDYTFGGNVTVGGNARETYDNLKAAVHADIASGALAYVTELIHTYGTVSSGRIYIVGRGGAGKFVPGEVTTNAANLTISDVAAFNTVRQPVVVSFANSGTGSSFQMSVAPAALAEIILQSADNGKATKFKYELTSGPIVVDWNATTRRLTLSLDSGSTLADIRAALVADSDVAALFDFTDVSGTPTDTIDIIADETMSPITADFDVHVVPDGYRIKVFPNDITWATANGYTNSSHFKHRGVKVGDRVRYSVIGNDSLVHEGETSVAALEADLVAAFIEQPTADSGDASTQTGDAIDPHVGVDIVIPGPDNQRAFDGAGTLVYALSNSVRAFPGDYSAGVLEDTFTVTISHGGAAGTARATVSTASGAYYRTDVPLMSLNWDDPNAGDMAQLYLGNNLWLVLHKGSSDPDAEFKVGDTYTFSRAIVAPWTSLTASQLISGGAYTGSRDTTYVLEVVRGGVFDRTVNTLDGLQSPNKFVITYTGQPASTDPISIAGMVFRFNAGVDPSDIVVPIGGSADITYGDLVTAINTSDGAIFAEQSLGVVTIHCASDIATAAACTLTNATGARTTAILTPVIDFNTGDWLAGDVDDEYILRCTQAGTITTAVFTTTSLRGDNVTTVQFAGTGSGEAIAIGTQGLKAYFTLGTPTTAFAVGDFWILRVNGTRPQVKVTDTAGVDQSTYVVVSNNTVFDLGLYGVTAQFDVNSNNEGGFVSDGGLITGDIYYVDAVAVANGPIKTLVLADDLPVEAVPGLDVNTSGSTVVYTPNQAPSLFSAWLYLTQGVNQVTSKKFQAPPERNWLTTEDDVTVYKDIAVQDASWTEMDGSMPYLTVYKGDLFLEYRALVTDYADSIYSLNDIADVITELGVITPDNPLAQAVYNALLNSDNQPVYFMAVRSDDLAGYLPVLDQASKTDVVYGLNPLTHAADIKTAVEAHILAMSTEESKRWRVGAFGSTLPTLKAVYTSETFPGGGTYLATITDNPSIVGMQYTLVTITNDAPSALADVKQGDLVYANFSTDAWGDATYATYEVASVLSSNKFLLRTGPTAPGKTMIEVWHPRTTNEIADAVATQSRYYASRRILNVFPDVAYLGGVAQPSQFIASAAVGLISSVPPHQGLTNIEVQGFDDIPAVYSTFTREQLNTMAAGGTFILMQNMAGDTIYVRHQLTTATALGNLMTSELSITKNLDAISYYFAGVLEPYIGRYNVTQELLTVIKTLVNNGLSYLGSDQTSVGLLGPMIILGDNTAIKTIEQHPTLKDHIIIVVTIELPVPANVIELHLVV